MPTIHTMTTNHTVPGLPGLPGLPEIPEIPGTRILVVDDNSDFLASAVRFLADAPDLEVVAAALSAREALDQIEVLRPDLVLMDVVMPGMDGLQATRLIKSSPMCAKVIVWTLYSDPRYHAAAVAAGADGFVAKSDLRKQLLPLIYRIIEQKSNEPPEEQPAHSK